MENKMSEVAKLLGLELEEEFKIKGVPERYKFTEIGLKYFSTKEKGWFLTNNILNLLLAGELTIKKYLNQFLTMQRKDTYQVLSDHSKTRLSQLLKGPPIMENLLIL